MSPAAGFELRGQFVITRGRDLLGSAETGDRRRLVAGVFTDSVQHHNGVQIVPVFEPGAIDLGLVRSGRCPILADHRHIVTDLLGAVGEAWLEGGQLHVIGRLACGGEADRVWHLLRQGFPLSLSLGLSVHDAEPAGERRWKATRWTLAEVSVVVHGRNQGVHLRFLDQEPDAFAEFAKGVQDAVENSRVAVHRKLYLDRWQRWTTGAGSSIAARLGVGRDRLCDLLDAEVRRHVERLQDDLAA